MEIIIFLFICFFKYILTQLDVILDFQPIIDEINEISIDSTDSKKIIDSTKILMNEYPFINILKDPPNIDGKDYFEKVDIMKELDELQSIIENSQMNLYEYYQRYCKIIRDTNDLHIGFYYDSNISLELSNTILISPFTIKTEIDKKSYLLHNELINYFEIESEIPFFEKIIEKENIQIKNINGQNPFDFIRNFCKDYYTFKNKNAKFSYTKLLLENYFYLTSCPLNSNEFYLNIEYEDGDYINATLIGLFVDYNETYTNNQNYEYFMNFIKKEKENKRKGYFTNRKLLKNYLKSKSNNKTIFRKLEEKEIIWDIEYDYIKCRVDEENKVNVYYQNSFMIDFNSMYLFEELVLCQYNFLNNDYPIVVIQDANGGGYVHFSMFFQEIVQNLFNNQMKCSIKIGEYTSNISDNIALYFDFLKENGDPYESTEELLKDFTIDKLSKDNENKRLKQRPFYIHYVQFYKDLIIRNKYKKPTEIIIYTDGFSFSATSLFIKSLYHFGGAITVGYNGDPDTEKKDFDASQSPTFVLPNEYIEIPGFKTLEDYGFYFSQISYGPSYKNQFIEGQLDYPEEFQVTPVDERVEIYNTYDDSLYQSFIDKAKEIFKKYNEEGKCNPENKNLKMLNKECDKNFDSVTHGGYECGDDGKWSKTCKPFYCHKNYYFDYVNQKCVKDVFPEKYSYYYEQRTEEEQKIEELEKENEELEKKNEELKKKNEELEKKKKDDKYKGLFIFLLVVLILIVLVALFCFLKIKFKINIFNKSDDTMIEKTINSNY